MHACKHGIMAVVITGILCSAGPPAQAAPAGIAEQYGDRPPGTSSPIVRALLIEQGKQGTDWAMRKQALLEYSARIAEKNEMPLKEFKGGDNDAALAIERGKAAMVFHQIRALLGEDVFSRAAGEIVSAGSINTVSWDDVQSLFEKETHKDLGWFFKQWIDRKGLPDLRMENASARRDGNGFEVSFDIVQEGEAYTLNVPVFVSFARGDGKTYFFKTDTGKKHVVVAVDEEPRMLVADRDYDLPRKLMEEESPPLLATLFGDEKPVIVLPVAKRDIYAPLIEALKQRGGEEREPGALTTAGIKSSSLAVMGNDNPVLFRLYGKVDTEAGAVTLIAKRNPWAPERVVVVIDAESSGAAGAFAQPVFRYGGFSSVAFSQKQPEPATRIDASQRGMEMELRVPAAVIDVSALKTLDNVIKDAKDKRIIYVGEYHDQYAHHLVELQVLKDLYRKGEKLAVGMEMFQRPFQKVLDQYIAGAIDERSFLKQTEYFKRWGYDYSLYKPILDFARAEKIPVIALNVKKEITDKVAKNGMDSLTAEEKADIPAQLDFSDQDYRERLRDVFNRHKGSGDRSFDFFFQAQILWDESMAASVDEFLKKNPDYRVVVMAGGGHLAYGSGIPKRAFRRNGLPYSILLNDSSVEADIAQYIVMPQPIEGVPAPRIMAALAVENNRVVVKDMPPDSVSRKAGIKNGDAILMFDGIPIQTIEDLKLELFFKKKDDVVKVKVLRKRFLFGDKEMEFDVKL